MDHSMNQIALGVGHDVPLAPLDLLARIIAPLSVVLMLQLSITPALGEVLRPMALRPISSRA
jgi:hypothetical protein